jgi:hypothetical protein
MPKIAAIGGMPLSSLPTDRKSLVRHPVRASWVTAALLLLCPALAACQTQSTGVLCRAGDGNFDAQFRTGVKVHVGAARSGGVATLATRSCAAKLSWEKQELAVVTDVAQLDLDAFGVDFGDGVPAAAFQFKKSGEDCCMEYRVYSLEKPRRLLRTITGGDFYSASDVDLDGRIEIWTHDAAAANGFEKLGLSEMDLPPTVVLRLEHGQLLDVSSEFQSYFDGEIAKIKAELLPQDREAFKASDGKLTADSPNSAERLHRLRLIKIKVLEIVWAYLYSGRDDEGWRSFAEMWPTAHMDRVRSALLQARTEGFATKKMACLPAHLLARKNGPRFSKHPEFPVPRADSRSFPRKTSCLNSHPSLISVSQCRRCRNYFSILSLIPPGKSEPPNPPRKRRSAIRIV